MIEPHRLKPKRERISKLNLETKAKNNMQIREEIYRGEHSTGISWPPAFEEATSPHIDVASLKKP